MAKKKVAEDGQMGVFAHTPRGTRAHTHTQSELLSQKMETDETATTQLVTEP